MNKWRQTTFIFWVSSRLAGKISTCPSWQVHGQSVLSWLYLRCQCEKSPDRENYLSNDLREFKIRVAQKMSLGCLGSKVLPQKWQLRSHEHVCKLVKMTPKRYVHLVPR